MHACTRGDGVCCLNRLSVCIHTCTHAQSPRAEAYTKEEHRQMVAEYFSGASTTSFLCAPAIVADLL